MLLKRFEGSSSIDSVRGLNNLGGNSDYADMGYNNRQKTQFYTEKLPHIYRQQAVCTGNQLVTACFLVQYKSMKMSTRRYSMPNVCTSRLV